MSIYNLDFLFKPKRIALIGVTPGEHSPSEILLRNLVWQNFKGEVYPVSREPVTICGLESYPSLASIPRSIDLAIIASPMEHILEDLESCVKKGVKAVALLARDFRARVRNPEALLSQIYRYVIQHKIRIIGPNTLGFICPPLNINASVIPHMPPPGNLAFISDSSTLASAVLDWIAKKKVGLSLFVSLGEKIDVDMGDMIDYLSMDYRTRALIIYLEKLKESRKFIGAARAFSRTKPIMVVKNGRFVSFDGRYFTELGQLLSEDMVYDTAFRRAGIIRVEEVLELFYVAESLAKQPRPKGPRLLIVSNAGGPALIAQDTLQTYNGKLAVLSPPTKKALADFLPAERIKNPLDLLSNASPAQYRTAIDLCLKDPNVDGVITIYTPEIEVSSEDIAWAVIRAAQSNKRKPVLACFMGEERVNPGRQLLSEHNIPNFLTPVETVKSFLYMYSYDHLLKLLFETPGSILEDFEPQEEEVRRIIRQASHRDQLLLEQDEALEILKYYGIKTRKLLMPPSQERFFPLMLGMIKDKVFGAVIAFGLGSQFTTALKDVALALPPLNQTLARRLLEQTQIYQYFCRQKISTEPLEELLVRFSLLIVDFPEIREIELNPIWFSENGYFVAQAHLYLEDFAFLPRTKPKSFYCPAHLSICPYPSHFIFHACLKDGTEVKVRPIKPEDEPLIADLFYSLSGDSVRFRFMQPKKTITHEELVRYCQIDYDRELILIALIEQQGEYKVIGMVSLSKYPDEENAEMAVVVADDWQGKGLGWLLCSQMIHIAKQSGLKRIWMEILQENSKMLKLAQKLDFKIHSQEEDVIKVVLEL